MLVTYTFMLMAIRLCRVHMFACAWRGIRAAPSVAEGDITQSYFEACHFVLSFLVGELLRDPARLVESRFTISMIIVAFVVSGAFIGSLTAAMTRPQNIAGRWLARLQVLVRYLSDHGDRASSLPAPPRSWC